MSWPSLRVALGALAGACAVAVPLTLLGSESDERPPSAATAQAARYGTLPMAFEPNAGRTDGSVRYLARGAGYTAYLTRREAVLALDNTRGALRVGFGGSTGAERVVAGRRLPGRVNWFVGDRRKWRSNVPTYRGVSLERVYPGIDVAFEGSRGQLRFDFLVAPGADPGRIRLDLAGARGLRVAPGGDLVMRVGGRELRQRRPIAFQGRSPVAARYVIEAGRRVRIALGAYDRTRPLVIDPVIAYSSYLGGTSDDQINDIAIDSSGAAYLTGETSSTNFPTQGAPANVHGTGVEAFVTKVNAAGTAIVYSTYLGGSSWDSVFGYPTADDGGQGIGVTSSGQAVVAGYTASTNFPTTASPIQSNSSLAGSLDGFVTKLAADGASLVYSTYIGGNNTDQFDGVAVDSSGNAYAAGQSNSTTTLSPTVIGTNGGWDALVVKINSTGTTRSYAIKVGGGGNEQTPGIAVDASGSVYVAGVTSSSGANDYPTTTGAYRTTDIDPRDSATQGGDAYDSFLFKYTSGSSLAYSTYLAGSSNEGLDEKYGVAVDSSGNAYVTGETGSSDFPDPEGTATRPATSLDGTVGGVGDAYALKMNSTGSAVTWWTYLGGSSSEDNGDIALDGSNNAYVAGTTASTDFPALNAIDTDDGSSDAFVAKIKANGSGFVYRSYLSGGAPDTGRAIAARTDGTSAYAITGGDTNVADILPSSTLQETGAGGADGWFAKLSPKPAAISSGPSGATTDSTPTFDFASDTGSTFTCSVDAPGSLGACSGTGTHTTGALSDGAHTFYVRAADSAGSTASTTSRAFTVDTQPPAEFALRDPADGASEQPFIPTFTWDPASDATSGVSRYELWIDGGKAADVTSCTDVCSAAAPGPLPEGLRNWQVKAFDAAGNVRESGLRTFSLGVRPAAVMVAAPNPALVGAPVTFDGSQSSDENGTIALYEWDLDGDGQFETNTGSTPTAQKSYELPGTPTVQLRVTDAVGLTGTTSVPLKITTRPGAGEQLGVSINAGAQFTNEPDVVVTAVFPPTTTTLLFSNDGGFFTPSSFAPKRETPWKLDSSGPERLPKTIYVRFLAGPFVSANFTDDIILDETPPKVLAATVPAAAPAAARAAAKRTYTIRVKARDNVSGVGHAQVTNNKRKPGRFLKYRAKLRVRATSPKLWVRVRDKAKNLSRWRAVKRG